MSAFPKSIAGTTKAWLASDYYGPVEIARDGSKAIGNMHYSNIDMSTSGWTHIGEAEITVTFHSEDQIIGNKVESLKAEKKKVLADAQTAATRIEEKIQKLLAISYTPEAS